MAEVVVVMGIIVVIMAVSIPFFNKYQTRKTFTNELTTLQTVIRDTERRARIQENGLSWGIRFVNTTSSSQDRYEVFSGNAYASSAVDKVYTMNNLVLFSDPLDGMSKDVFFSAVTGLPRASISLTLTQKGNTTSSIIQILANGILTVQ